MNYECALAMRLGVFSGIKPYMYDLPWKSQGFFALKSHRRKLVARYVIVQTCEKEYVNEMANVDSKSAGVCLIPF